MRRLFWVSLLAILSLMVFSACAAPAAPAGDSGDAAAEEAPAAEEASEEGGDEGSITVLLPDSASSARWEADDRRFLVGLVVVAIAALKYQMAMTSYRIFHLP